MELFSLVLIKTIEISKICSNRPWSGTGPVVADLGLQIFKNRVSSAIPLIHIYMLTTTIKRKFKC